MQKEDNGIFGGDKNNSASVRELISRYLAYWPLFIVSILLCTGAGVIYSMYAVPKYIASTAFLIKTDGGGNSTDLIESAINGGKKRVNLNNEVMLLKSARVMQRTVAKNNFNVSYFRKGRLHSIEIYQDAPFILTYKQGIDTNQAYNFHIEKLNPAGGSFSAAGLKDEKSYSFRWSEPFSYRGQIFVLTPTKAITADEGKFLVSWYPVTAAAASFSGSMTVQALDPRTAVLDLTIKTQNLQKGKDLLNALFVEFNQSDIEERNRLSESTVKFIDDRLFSISGELKGVEGNLENYQTSNNLINIGSQSSQSLGNSDATAKAIKDLAIQQSIASMILNYFTNPESGGKLVPSSLGLNDGTLAALIGQYNELQLKKEREAPSVAPNSTVMQDLNTQLASLRSSILESLNNITRNLRLQQGGLQQQNNQYQNALSSVPHNERVLQEIKRKQSITEGLYLYLLQEREEAAISSTTSNISNYKQIDSAIGYGPVEPNKRNIILYTALLGFAIAFGCIYLKDLLNDKISSREDIVKRTSLPLLGQISHIAKKKKQVIAVLDRSITGEQFRAIRTNMYFLLKDKSKKVILITSSVSGEGKSFVSLNLAAVCAMPGKKIALLEFDIRQPVLMSNLNVESSKGLSDYLTGKVDNIAEITHVVDEIPNLHIFPAGPVPSNPADILLSENMNSLFDALKAKYDYIIIDSPPATMVSDPFILGEFSNIVLYVARNQKTVKRQIDFINEIVRDKTLSNVTIVLNDVQKGDSYGYGYGSGDYGNYYGSKKKKKFSLLN